MIRTCFIKKPFNSDKTMWKENKTDYTSIFNPMGCTKLLHWEIYNVFV
jgi:hypothetical protein